jgi:urea transport system permease protein
MIFRVLLLVLAACLPSVAMASYEDVALQLNHPSFVKKQQAVQTLMGSEAYASDARTLPLLAAFSEGKLFFLASQQTLVTTQSAEGGMLATDLVRGSAPVVVQTRDIKRVTINNGLRSKVKGALAGLRLASGDPVIRRSAAESLVASPDPAFRETLAAALARETDASVAQAFKLALAMLDVRSDDRDARLQAVKSLADALDPQVITLLETLTARDESGKPVEADDEIRHTAQAILTSAEQKRAFYRGVEDVVFGISLGSVLLLSAVGLAITFGVMGVINMAHGEMMMIGAYTTYVIQQWMPNHIDISLIVAIPAAFVVAGAVGVAMERGMIRFLYGRPLETLLATFGISLILQQAARSIFSPLNKSVASPEWMSGLWQINPALAITYCRFYIIVFSLLVFAGLVIAIRRTAFGLQMRAVTQNRAMASSMGIRTGWVDALTFGLGSGIAGIAGVALSQLTNVGPNLGQAYIVDSFMVVVFGGVGNLFGTLFGALTLGIVNKLMEPMIGAVLAKIVVLVFIILFIQRRPRGMFALKGRFVEG